jgi:hypothetical protein
MESRLRAKCRVGYIFRLKAGLHASPRRSTTESSEARALAHGDEEDSVAGRVGFYGFA